MELFAGATDALLALVCASLGLRLLNRGGVSAGTGGVGLLLVAVAAGFGAVRFTVAPDIAPAHDGLSRMAGMVGEPLLGTGYLTAVFAAAWAARARSVVFVVTLVGSVLLVDAPLWRTGLAGAGMLAAGVGALASRRGDVAALGVSGAALTVVSGLVIGAEGELFGLARAGWFHLGLTASHALLALGLLRLDPAPDPEG
jgi:hypothetical protein